MILCFHGLLADDADPGASMHVSLRQLTGIVTAVRRMGRLVSLEKLLACYSAGQSTAGLVAITADDAYASWGLAESLLCKQKVPLTIFPVGNALNTGSRFWWDRLDEAAARSPKERWRQLEAECGLPNAFVIGQPDHEGLSRPLRQWVLSEHCGRWPASLDSPLSRLEDELGVHTAQRSMTHEELRGFAERTGASVAVHTLSHAALPFLDDHEAIEEIAAGAAAVRATWPATLPILAIPFGLFDRRTVALARQAGMTCALTLAGHPLDARPGVGYGVSRVCVVREHIPGVLALKVSTVGSLVARLRRESREAFPLLPSPTT